MFIDNSNIFRGSQQAGWRIDAKKLHAKLEADGEIWQTFFFAAVSDPPRYSQTNFYRMLRNDLHYEMTVLPLGSKTVRCSKCGHSRRSYTEKGIDVALATRLLVLANNNGFETAILVSGDRDYLETIKAVKSLGKRVEIVSWRQSLSQDLAQESSKNAILLDDIRVEIERATPDVEIEQLMTPEGEI